MAGLRRLAFATLPAIALAGTRKFRVKNECAFTVWPAVTNYDDGAKNYWIYKGLHGWEAKPGHQEEFEVESPWNGRIWARRECRFDESGKGSCTTGDCTGELECADQEIGDVNVGEWNLDSWGGMDFWDISCVPGWTLPMSIVPDGECDPLSCTKDVNAACPDDRMKLKDADGNVIGCLSACMAKINAEEPSMNCCSGTYNSMEACAPPSQVDFYDTLKPLCENAYW
ncbi:thaumatin family protein [Rhodotorula paludigena]|uniref:thaumatin family protein n=1 Tax=Rhodotorula paludigena TaxID=86838 RepID=UPI003171201A